MLGTLLVAFAWLFLCPDQALAWGPGTHIALGETLLESLWLLPPNPAGDPRALAAAFSLRLRGG